MTLGRILDHDLNELLKEERQALADVRSALEHMGDADDELVVLDESIRQLDELFLLVVVGEFNSGKSAFINAILGEAVLAEGVTPTTSRIHLVRHGEATSRRPLDAVQEVVTSPLDLLEELTIVDTPGTNALDRRHEALTSDFVPRSDLVIFVTSADRPFSESERVFLERIREWGKKVVVIINKVDNVRGEDEVREISSYVEEASRRLLDFAPPVFAVSSLKAQEARRDADDALLAASGLPAVEEHLRSTLDDVGRVRLKLGNPLGVAANLVDRRRRLVDDRLVALREDLQTVDDIESQLAVYAEDVDREFRFRLSDIDNVLHQMEKRGIDFFDDTVRLRRLAKLLDKHRLRSDFESEVVADAPQQVETKVDAIIDWLVTSDLQQWQAVVNHVSRRRSEHADRIVGDVGNRFDTNRAGLLETVGRAARDGLERYDRSAEARRIADDVQRAVAGTAIVEVGAVGLGATISLLASGSAADATGLVAAGTVAALGLFILPHRRRRAKRELADKISAVRSELMTTLDDQFGRQAELSRHRIRDTIAPYSRFVRSERERFGARANELATLAGRLEQLRARIDGPTTESA